MASPRPRVAALDVGTHSIHLVIASLDTGRGRFRVLHREKELVRLGQGGHPHLSEAAMSRGIAALRRLRRTAEAAGARLRAIATSAVREADNRDVFLQRVESRTGIRLKIASGAEEARLTWLGVQHALGLPARSRALLLDVGGGSTEFLVGTPHRVLYTNSLKIGAVRISERFFPGGRVDLERVRECRQFLRGTLEPVLRDLRRQRFMRVVGSSGTLSTLAAMARELRGEEPGDPAESPLSRAELSSLVKRLTRTRTPSERANLPGMDPRRADVIVGGALIVDEVFRGAGLRGVDVSSMALREGILVDELQRRAHRLGRRRLQNGRLASVEELARNFQTDVKHGRQVARLALEIFDTTERLHQMGDAEREYLEVASRLHEAGFFISHAGHHRHSYYLIRNSDLLGFTENEKEMIALIARYHRKGPPRLRHEGFCDLELDERLTVTRLASILRIADGLDRSHRSAVKGMACKLTRGRLTLRLRRARAAQLDLEVWGASRKSDLFEKTFGRRVEFAVSGR